MNEPLWRICKDWSAVEITGEEVSETISRIHEQLNSDHKEQINSLKLNVIFLNISNYQLTGGGYFQHDIVLQIPVVKKN